MLPSEPLLALSLVQPMAWGIAEGGKLLENRTWPQLKRGLDGLARLTVGNRPLRPFETFAIHASGRPTPPIGYLDTCLYAAERDALPRSSKIRSALLATAQVVDVMRADHGGAICAPDWQRLVDRLGLDGATRAARWWSGPYALVLDHVRQLEAPIGQVKGALYFWPLQPEHDRIVRAQLARAA